MIKSKLILFVLCFFLLLSEGKSQEMVPSKNSIFFEILGNGGLYSINYERSLNANLNVRIGFCTFISVDFLGGGEPGGRISTVPLMATYVSGKKKSHFETGGGMLFGNDGNEHPGTIIDLIAFIGYRYQAPGKGILIRVGLTPFLSIDNKANYPDKGLLLSGGISLGYHF